MTLGRLVRRESLQGFLTRVILGIGLPLSVVAGTLITVFVWRQNSALGLQADYFANREDTQPFLSRTYRRVLIYHEEPSSPRGLRQSYFAVWSGFLLAPSNATYSLSTLSDDGIRVFVDDSPVIDNWNNRGWKGSGMTAEVELRAGSHRLRIEHHNRSGSSGVALFWGGGGIEPGTVLATPYIVKRIE